MKSRIEQPARSGGKPQFDSLEAHLSSALQPVAPRPTFVQTLGQRLSSAPSVAVKIHPAAGRDWQLMLIAAAGVLSGVALIWLVKAFVLAYRRSKNLT